jgi:hypothetical protein
MVGRPCEAMEGTESFPANFLYLTFYRNTLGEPPMPPIASQLSFLLSLYFLK